ncbi:MAG: hypothetical protein ABIQ66_08575 [Novosphingobium sp.]
MAFEFVGKTYRFDYDGFVAEDHFSQDEVHFEVVGGPITGLRGSARYTAREVAKGIYAISWQEADGSTVVHVDNFTDGVSLSYFTDASSNFYQMHGTLSAIG